MTLPENYTLTIEQGATLKRRFALQHLDGTIADLIAIGYTIGLLKVRQDYDSPAFLTLSETNGGVSMVRHVDVNGRFWSGYLYCSPAVTAGLTPWGDGVYDFEVSNGADVIRVLQGKAWLSRESSY